VVTDDEYILTPNAETARTIVKARAGVDLHTARDAEDLFKQLGI
jgi:antitoxin component of RelBE/YafQ-DinJ toxin-antitoxin module